MTTPISDSSAPVDEPRAESFLDWFQINSRLVTIGTTVVVVVALGLWIVKKTNANAIVNSDKQLMVAKQSLGSGNQQLAEADLKKVVDKYGDKPAGAEAGMLLAQLQLDRGDAASAITGLTALVGKAGSGPNAPAVVGLLGDAQVQGGKFADAAASYEKAATITNMPSEKQFWLNKAARAYVAGGNAAKAKTLYEALASQSDNDVVATEAKVRIGEMATAAKP
jgi:TolA-binding protein